MMTTETDLNEPAPQAWWKYGYLWLIVLGPAAVVLAGFVTLWLAVRTPDPLVAQDYYRRGIELSGKAAAELAPAVQARNHLATGQPPQKP
jgi:uncharacterized protein